MRGCKNYLKFICGPLVALLLLMPTMTFAQGDPPADGCDPYDGCNVPLDTWVILLAVIAVAYGAYRLHSKQRAATA